MRVQFELMRLSAADYKHLDHMDASDKKKKEKKAPLAHVSAAIKLAFINHRLILKGIDRLNVLRAFEFSRKL